MRVVRGEEMKEHPFLGHSIDDDIDISDEEWKREGRRGEQEKKWLQERTQRLAAERERWKKEHVVCPYCNRWYWPHELESHVLCCRERYF